MRVVLDTNVLISAIVFGGNPREILDAVFRGEIALYFSRFILEELEAVLGRPKFGFPPEVIQTILTELNTAGTLFVPTIRIDGIKEDSGDNRMIECAVEANADYLVTGDAHLPDLKRYKQVKIMNPTDYLVILSEGREP